MAQETERSAPIPVVYGLRDGWLAGRLIASLRREGVSCRGYPLSDVLPFRGLPGEPGTQASPVAIVLWSAGTVGRLCARPSLAARLRRCDVVDLLLDHAAVEPYGGTPVDMTSWEGEPTHEALTALTSVLRARGVEARRSPGASPRVRWRPWRRAAALAVAGLLFTALVSARSQRDLPASPRAPERAAFLAPGQLRARQADEVAWTVVLAATGADETLRAIERYRALGGAGQHGVAADRLERDSRELVAAVQTELVRLGYRDTTISGVIDQPMREAIEDVRRRTGWPGSEIDRGLLVLVRGLGSRSPDDQASRSPVHGAASSPRPLSDNAFDVRP